MKKIIIALTIALLWSTNAFAAQKDIQVDRGQAWLRFAAKAKLTNTGIGAFAMIGSRYNFTVDKTIDGVETPTEDGKSWLNELWVGPNYKTKFGPVGFITMPLYRLQQWNFSEVGTNSKTWYRHTLAWHNILSYNLGFGTLRYRFIFWNQFEQDAETVTNITTKYDKQDDAAKKITVNDHYLMAQATLKLNFAPKKAK